MSDVKRWTPGGIVPFGTDEGKRLMIVRSNGGYVAWSDYDAKCAEVERLREELRNIANADPSTWDADVRDQFKQWAQNRARAALGAADQQTAAQVDKT